MANKTVEEQMAMLQQMTSPVLVQRMRWASAGILAGMAGMAMYTLHGGWIMGTLVIGLMTWGIFSSVPHLRNAARGAREGERQPGEAALRPNPDSESGEFLAEVIEASGQGWTFAFIPQGWKPRAERVPVSVVRLPDVTWPVLVIGPEGVMLPRNAPERLPVIGA
ncbi:hypothetical protein [Megalodesulfovibrio paquesii]